MKEKSCARSNLALLALAEQMFDENQEQIRGIGLVQISKDKTAKAGLPERQ